eukprot:jgi/Tetstr1/434173/TSEL_023284.t1
MEDVARLREAAGSANRSIVVHPDAPMEHHGGVRSSMEIPTTRVYAHVTAEAQIAIGNPFTSTKRNPAMDGKSDRSKPIQSLDDNGFLEVYPRSSSRQPHLLQQLEILLQDRLHKGEKLASPLGPGHRNPAIAANLKLHAHRDVWDAFISSFGTYQPLMAEIKKEYDAALHQSLIAAGGEPVDADGVGGGGGETGQLPPFLAPSDYASLSLRRSGLRSSRQAASVDKAVQEVTASTANEMQELADKLAATERRAAQLEARATAVEALATSARTDASACQEAVERSKAMHTQLLARLAGEQEWLAKPGSKEVKGIEIGPYMEEKGEEEEHHGAEATPPP